jgi:hypothetical protein
MDRIMRGEGKERGTAEALPSSALLLKKGHLIEDEEENFQACVARWPSFRPHNSKKRGANRNFLCWTFGLVFQQNFCMTAGLGKIQLWHLITQKCDPLMN